MHMCSRSLWLFGLPGILFSQPPLLEIHSRFFVYADYVFLDTIHVILVIPKGQRWDSCMQESRPVAALKFVNPEFIARTRIPRSARS